MEIENGSMWRRFTSKSGKSWEQEPHKGDMVQVIVAQLNVVRFHSTRHDRAFDWPRDRFVDNFEPLMETDSFAPVED